MGMWDRDCETCGHMMPDCICGDDETDMSVDWEAVHKALTLDVVLNIEAIVYDKQPAAVQPYLTVVRAARWAAALHKWEVDWCESHFSAGDTRNACEAKLISSGLGACKIVRKALIDVGGRR